MSHPRIRVLLVDAHQVVRQGLRLLIESEGIAVVGDTGSGAAAVELTARASPDVVVIDPALPDMTGIDLLVAIRGRGLRAKAIVLASETDPAAVRGLLTAGACGYLLKSIDRRGLVDAIRGAVDGRYSLEPAAVALLTEPAPPGTPSLTRREREVLRLAAEGLTNRMIANELDIRPGTVRVYLSEIFLKLGVANRTEAAMAAIRYGLVSPNEKRAAGQHG